MPSVGVLKTVNSRQYQTVTRVRRRTLTEPCKRGYCSGFPVPGFLGHDTGLHRINHHKIDPSGTLPAMFRLMTSIPWLRTSRTVSPASELPIHLNTISKALEASDS